MAKVLPLAFVKKKQKKNTGTKETKEIPFSLGESREAKQVLVQLYTNRQPNFIFMPTLVVDLK